MKSSVKGIINFLAEAGQLKRVKRSGWWVAGIRDPESVAEHSFRCAVIGYILARMEKANSHKVLLMCLFNDIHEARINDLHKVGHRYIDFKKSEDKVFKEQAKLLPSRIAWEFLLTRRSYNRQDTKEAVIARDADILECILQAKEYLDIGYKQTKSFLAPGEKFLMTKSARILFKEIKKWRSSDWWLHLKVFER
ncbi:MAG: HD domain-containing protein [Candidatus Omnitrophica bacterium]|nr:HD domain-containing protein [Candidatus Omnitrophota bacterium]